MLINIGDGQDIPHLQCHIVNMTILHVLGEGGGEGEGETQFKVNKNWLNSKQ